MSDNTYNGWTNYETWQAALWLNETDLIGRCQEDDIPSVDHDMLDFELYELAGGDSLRGLARDIFNGWISCVNMLELVESFNKDLEAY